MHTCTPGRNVIHVLWEQIALGVRRFDQRRKVGRKIVDQHRVLLVHTAGKSIEITASLVDEESGKILVRADRVRRVGYVSILDPLVDVFLRMELNTVERVPKARYVNFAQ